MFGFRVGFASLRVLVILLRGWRFVSRLRVLVLLCGVFGNSVFWLGNTGLCFCVIGFFCVGLLFVVYSVVETVSLGCLEWALCGLVRFLFALLVGGCFEVYLQCLEGLFVCRCFLVGVGCGLVC